jgi:hypothetical protein
MKRIEILNHLLSTDEFKPHLWVETTPEIAGWISCENEVKELVL